METATHPIDQALLQLKKLDDQLAKGRITQSELEAQRLVVLVDLIIAKS